MKLQALTVLCTIALVNAHALHADRIARHAHIARQNTDTTSSSPAAPSPTTTATDTPPANTSNAPPPPPGPPQGTTSDTGSAGAPTGTTTGSTTASEPATPTYDINGIPPISHITSGMPTGTTYAVSHTYTPGAKPTAPAGAPALPQFTFVPSEWPAMDKPPPTDSPEVQAWMKELEGHDIPDLSVTVDGTCASDPAAFADAEKRGWWSCGGWTRPTDIIDCPDKFTWGVSFDDGPSPYTQKLLNYMDSMNMKATFFVVGSRALEYPNLLIEEYMAGHEISVHTWAHPPLTSRTTAQIVAELGWTRLIIQKVLGITPTTMRAPYGDIDDRVRAIALAMGMVPIQWTRTPEFTFDTNDWKVASGAVTGPQQMETFQTILSSASNMNNGFIVLAHDLYEITVDLAVGYTLPAALAHNPPFQIKRIGECNNIPMSNLYVETNKNATFPGPGATNASNPLPGGGVPGKGGNGSGAAAGGNNSGASSLQLPLVSAFVAAGFAALGAIF
ncbi:carbohydrate esterase family 4 protein [Cristinia sonorae]|uniref:chitin deacetylase n=1 Tax=Cristinia sonorae TaxID=1940300 RepID=A0A8K0XJK0_9AGAR|nr:carbohydrate esterase family 4 protein [Cristinia sonorae]